MTMCSGKHCVWCEICLDTNEVISCDNCRKQVVTQKLFDEIIKESY